MQSSPVYPLGFTPLELQNSIETPADILEVTELLHAHPPLYPQFLHFQSVYWTIIHLETMVQRYQEELHPVFDNMQNHEIEDAMAFFITQKWCAQYHPNSHPRTPSNLSSSDPPSSIHIWSTQAVTPNSLYYTPDEFELGSQENPIYVPGGNECERCHDEEHFIWQCTREYWWNGREYTPVPINDTQMKPTYVIDCDYHRPVEVQVDIQVSTNIHSDPSQSAWVSSHCTKSGILGR
jgi:hypothetical protein